MKKPCIALALGSGAARGFAHIGVIKQLLKLNIKPTIVSGCSVGALVGGAYAANMLDELEYWSKTLNLKRFLELCDVSINSGGMIIGDNFTNFLMNFFANITIESLDIPFKSVACDIISGKEIYFNSGPLHEAIRASMSLPGLFAPYKYKDCLLIDGGIVNPVPVSICRQMNADFVIAVNLNKDVVGKHFSENQPKTFQFIPESFNALNNLSDMIKKRLKYGANIIPQINDNKKSPKLLNVLASSINIMQDRITKCRLTSDPPDILIEPKLSHLGLFEYYRAEEAIFKGEKIVLKMKDEIISSINQFF